MENNQYRKPNRLKNYDYSSPGYYFITICTKQRESILWNSEFYESGSTIKNQYGINTNTAAGCEAKTISRVELFRRVLDDIEPVGAVRGRLPHDYLYTVEVPLSDIGEIIKEEFLIWNKKYENVYIDRYVIMPNHIHAIVVIMRKVNHDSHKYSCTDYRIKEKRSVSLMWMVNVFKGSVSKRIGKSIWQKGYHDHIIRNYDEYSLISKYICNNPRIWNLDCHNSFVR